jgi:acetoacetate decarboxylase
MVGPMSESLVPDLNGFMPPFTASGRSAIVPPMPWHYSGVLMTVEYRTDPQRVRSLLPADVDLAPEDPGAVALIWADWQSCSDGGEELLDPVRSQYIETFAVVRCSFQGTTYSRCVLIWVTKDFAMARGWFQGYPKKLGSMHMTRLMSRGKATPRLEPGARLGASLSAYDHRLASAVITLRGESETNGFVNALPMLHHRQMPSITKGAGLSFDQVVTMGGIDADLGTPWVGDAQLDLADSPWDELATALPVHEVINGYYREVGVTFAGGRLLEDRSRPV